MKLIIDVVKINLIVIFINIIIVYNNKFLENYFYNINTYNNIFIFFLN